MTGYLIAIGVFAVVIAGLAMAAAFGEDWWRKHH